MMKSHGGDDKGDDTGRGKRPRDDPPTPEPLVKKLRESISEALPWISSMKEIRSDPSCHALHNLIVHKTLHMQLGKMANERLYERFYMSMDRTSVRIIAAPNLLPASPWTDTTEEFYPVDGVPVLVGMSIRAFQQNFYKDKGFDVYTLPGNRHPLPATTVKVTLYKEDGSIHSAQLMDAFVQSVRYGVMLSCPECKGRFRTPVDPETGKLRVCPVSEHVCPRCSNKTCEQLRFKHESVEIRDGNFVLRGDEDMPLLVVLFVPLSAALQKEEDVPSDLHIARLQFDLFSDEAPKMPPHDMRIVRAFSPHIARFATRHWRVIVNHFWAFTQTAHLMELVKAVLIHTHLLWCVVKPITTDEARYRFAKLQLK